ncbi:right-handed parallel beta-helix repeat-containing protein [Bacteroidota bacterium]
MIKQFVFLLSLFFVLVSCQPGKVTIFVSPEGDNLNPGTKKLPVQTIPQVQQLIREKKSGSPGLDIEVLFREGVYSLTEPVIMSPNDGGGDGFSVSYSAYKGESVLISGGKKINNWTIENGIWKSQIEDVTDIQQLYINGERQTRARVPNIDEEINRWYLDSVYTVRTRDQKGFLQLDLWVQDKMALQKFNNPGDFEIIIFKDWATLRKQVSACDTQSGRIMLKPPFSIFEGNYNGLLAPYFKRFTCYFEGHHDFIDQPGEWAFDKNEAVLYYKPRSGQQPEDTEVIIPVHKKLIHMAGEKDSRIKNVHFSDINFGYAAYVLPDFGHDGRQACFFYNQGTGLSSSEALIEEAILVKWASDCSFNNCKISHTGANGLYVTKGSRDIQIDGMILEDIGGNSLMIGTAYDPGSENPELVKQITFTNGQVNHGGRHYQSAVGIWIGFGTDITISNNEVFDHPYTGISIGWQWNPVPSSSRDNTISGNHIYDVMKMLGDGGGIYTLGFQPGSVIRDNRIHDILRSELNHASPNNGMFIDEGSKGYLIENNLIYNVSHTCIRGHRASGVLLLNNTFVVDDMAAISHTPPYGNMIFANRDSTIVWPNPGWPAEWGYPDSITAFTMEGNQFINYDDWESEHR